jgi:hypothetical protein
MEYGPHFVVNSLQVYWRMNEEAGMFDTREAALERIGFMGKLEMLMEAA